MQNVYNSKRVSIDKLEPIFVAARTEMIGGQPLSIPEHNEIEFRLTDSYTGKQLNYTLYETAYAPQMLNDIIGLLLKELNRYLIRDI